MLINIQRVCHKSTLSTCELSTCDVDNFYKSSRGLCVDKACFAGYPLKRALTLKAGYITKNGFRFSRDKRFKRVSFEEFFAAAKALYRTVSTLRSSVEIEVVTAEDLITYDYTTTTFWTDEIERGLKNRKCYALDEFTRDVWERSFNVDVILRDEEDPEPFMICLSCDRRADAKRLLFYGQCLDEEMCNAVEKAFHRPSFFSGIGNGMPKISPFNILMGYRITGIRPPGRLL